MKVKELIRLLQGMPQEADVTVPMTGVPNFSLEILELEKVNERWVNIIYDDEGEDEDSGTQPDGMILSPPTIVKPFEFPQHDRN